MSARLVILGGLLLALALLRPSLACWHGALHGRPVASRSDLALAVLGEFRTFLARAMWMRVDLYHHQLERQGVPWNQERDLIPLYRAVTTIDPRFEDAYDVGSYELVINFGRAQEGIDYLDEGLRANPRSRLLHFDRAFVMHHLKRWRESVEDANTALALSVTSDDKRSALRLMASCGRQLDDRVLQARALFLWGELFPGDPVVRQHLDALARSR
ncbi:MAG: hypothetical protein FJX76_20130 [Armatimonadetes bacterium]|nr:hypothetical protein [Armatimonadota bacterium]